jgi:hypothetical protein
MTDSRRKYYANKQAVGDGVLDGRYWLMWDW